ncbi:MAG: integrin alpha [Chloroflexi bacterium]|nr:integrin alpha [Chloroflexota bacterium]
MIVKRVLAIVLFLALLSLFVGRGTSYAQDGGRADGSAGAHFSGEAPNDEAGASLASAGDINGDGYGDLLIGANLNDSGPGNNGGAAYLVLGGPGGWSLSKRLGQSPTIEYFGEADSDNAGISVAGAGDVNGDGFDDLLIGANLNDDGGGVGSNSGAAYLVLGSASPAGGNLNTTIQYTGEAASDNAGISVAGAGDINGDGFDDLLIGANLNGAGDNGAAYLVLGGGGLPAPGTQTSLATAVKYTGEAAGNQAGRSVAGAGDTDRDGLADMIIGAPLNADGGANAGAIYLLPGSAAPASISLSTAAPAVVQFTGAGGENAGTSVAGAGDANADGFADLLAGAPLNDAAGADAGAAYLVLLRPGIPPNSLSVAGIQYTGETAGDQAGTSVAGAGDVNGDSFADLLIGAPFNTSVDSGAAYLVLGSAGPASAGLSTAIRYTGALNNDQANIVAGAGDANGDGLADLLVGATDNDILFSNGGAAYLIFGGPLSSQTPAFRQRQNLNGSGNPLPVTFDQAGVRVDFTAGAFIDGDVNVTRYAFHPCATDKRLAMPIWTIESSKLTAGATVDLRFKYNEANIDGMVEGSLQVWQRPAGRPCAAWTAIGGAVDATHNFVTIAGLTSLGQFTISEGMPSPTALEERPLGVRLAQEPVELVVLLSLLVVMAGVTYWVMRRHAVALAAVPGESSEVAERLGRIERLLAQEKEDFDAKAPRRD